MKTLGVIGGLGPMAMVYFLQLVTEYTNVKRDQEHIPIVLMSIPDTPDRTEYILKKSTHDEIRNTCAEDGNDDTEDVNALATVSCGKDSEHDTDGNGHHQSTDTHVS